MADIWDAYVKKKGKTPCNASQLQQFTKASANMKPLTFKEARDLFNAHKTKPVVTNGANKKPPIKVGPKPTVKPKINKPIPSVQKYNIPPKKINTNNNPEIQRQIDECNMEINNLNTIEKDFSEGYNGQIKDIENQFKNLYDALKKREMDLKKWRKQEFDEGINSMKSTKQILNNRINDLNTNNNPNNIYNIPKLNDFYITRFTKHSLQIQNTLNNIFQIGETYQQNINNKQFISLKINKNPQNNINNIKMRNNNNNIQNNNKDKRALDFSASPFGKGKIIQNNNNINNKKKVKQNNGTKVLQYNNTNAGGIRGFDIGNNAKYANAQQYAQNTNTLPSNFWEDESESDSEEERQETTDDIVNRWKTQESNIRNNTRKQNKNQNANNNSIKTIKHSRVRSMYDASSSEDEHNDNENENDGFEKYIPPKPKPIDPIIEKQKQKEKEENYWKNNNTKWIIYAENKQFEYDSLWFKVPKMRNGKANGLQMKPFMQKSGLNNNILKQIWKLSDLDKDGKMGNEEFALCMYLMDKAKKGQKIPNKLPQNYIPPSFRGKMLIKTPPKKSKPLPNSKSAPPKMDLASAKSDGNNGNKQKYKVKPKGNVEKKEEKKEEKQEKDNGGKLEVKKDEKKEKVVKSEESEDKNKGKDDKVKGKKSVDEVK